MAFRYVIILGMLALLTAACQARQAISVLAGPPLSPQSEVDPDRSLLESMIRREQAAQSGSKLTPAERRNRLATAIERYALEAGFEVKAKLTGAKKDTLELQSPVFDKSMIYRAVVKGSSDLAGALRSAGIARVMVANGKQSWLFDTRSPEKWLEVLSAKNNK